MGAFYRVIVMYQDNGWVRSREVQAPDAWHAMKVYAEELHGEGHGDNCVVMGAVESEGRGTVFHYPADDNFLSAYVGDIAEQV